MISHDQDIGPLGMTLPFAEPDAIDKVCRAIAAGQVNKVPPRTSWEIEGTEVAKSFYKTGEPAAEVIKIEPEMQNRTWPKWLGYPTRMFPQVLRGHHATMRH